MNRRDFLKCSGMFATAFALGGCLADKAFTGTIVNKPNIILIVADDMGYGDAGCYGNTNLIPTPNIDRLAAEGVRFTDGYVTAPVCGPCRYGLLTGAYQQRFGIQWNSDCFAKLPAHVLQRLGIEQETLDNNRIPSSQKILNEPLEACGYTTGIIGKWNLPCYPLTPFDETMSVMHFGGDYWPDEKGHYNGVNEPVARSGQKRILWGPERPDDEYLTDRLGREAVEFIDRHKDGPFFLYLGFNAPHSPMQAKKTHLDAVLHLPTEALRFYAAMLLSMDENVGRVLDAVDQRGLAENTLVVFLSDNGPTYAYNVDWPTDWPKELLGSAGPLNGHKGQFLEGGIRVPFMMRWPAIWKGGQVYKEPVSALDIYPTLCSAASADIPVGTQLDGVDLVPYLCGDNKGTPHEMLFWHAYDRGAVRKGRWKLYVSEGAGKLYDLESDIGETVDVSSRYPELTEHLHAEYEKFCSQMPPALNPLR